MPTAEDRMSQAESNLADANTAASGVAGRFIDLNTNFANLFSLSLQYAAESDVDQSRISDLSDRGQALADDISALTAQLTAVGTNVEAGLTPALSAATSAANGFTVEVANYDDDYTWALDATEGGAANLTDNGDGTATIEVTGIDTGVSAVLAVTTSRSGYGTGVKSVIGASNP